MRKFIKIFGFVIYGFLFFGVVQCMDDKMDIEAGVNDGALEVVIDAAQLSMASKKDSDGVIVDLGKEKFNTFRLATYYNAATKTLDLSRKPMGDRGLKMIFDNVRHFVDANDVEILLLEFMELTEVPYYLITYALVNRHLRVVSFQNNKFELPGLPILPEMEFHVTLPVPQLPTVKISKNKIAAVDVEQAIQGSQAATSSHGGVGLVASIVTNLWAAVSPEIARELEAQNLGSGSVPLFKKIIFIDKRIPPFTVFDQTQAASLAAPSRCQKFKYVVERALYTVAGLFVSFLPQIIILFTSDKDDLGKCDQDALQKMMLACNVSSADFRGLYSPVCVQDMLNQLALDCNLTTT